MQASLPDSTSGLDPSCGDLRAATLRPGLRHVGYDAAGNHIDEAASSHGGDFAVNSIKVTEPGAGTVNCNVCLHLGRNGR